MAKGKCTVDEELRKCLEYLLNTKDENALPYEQCRIAVRKGRTPEDMRPFLRELYPQMSVH